MKRAALFAALLCLLPNAAQAAAWTQPQGDHYFKAWLRGMVGNRGYLHDGSSESLGSLYTDLAVNAYGEYGLGERLTLIAFGTPGGFAQFGQSRAGYVGLLAIGGRFGIVQEVVQVAIEGHYGYASAMGEKTLGRGVAAGKVFRYVPVVSSHRFEGELQLGYGLPFGWLTLVGGARFSTDPSLAAVPYALGQLGYQASHAVTLSLLLSYYEPLGKPDYNVSGAGQTRYLGFDLGGTYWLSKNWGVNLGLGGVAYASANAATPSWTLGVEHR